MASQSGKIRVGIIGSGRGMSFVTSAPHTGMELVALCDRWKERTKPFADHLGIATYEDYDTFLQHDMDAVILANNFHEHAPFAIKALDAGFHVMSETAACHTLAEGVALARAVEKSGKIYMFGENYPYSARNQEMRRLFKEGFAGKFLYGEGEYVHPMHPWSGNWLAPGHTHWRNWIPATYYCTHSMGPVMFITGTRPVKVNGFVVPRDLDDPFGMMRVSRQDTAGMIVCRMDNGAVVKLLQGGLRGHWSHVRIRGNKGAMEASATGPELSIRKEDWDTESGEKFVKSYVPEFPEHAEAAAATGHGGGDFFVELEFAEAIRSGNQPFQDVYRGIDMSIIGILAYRSALNDSASLDVPDFRDEAVRKQVENDDWSPAPENRREGQPYSSIRGNLEPSDKAKQYAETCWAEQKKHWEGKDWTKVDIDGSVIGTYTGKLMRDNVAKNLMDIELDRAAKE